MKPIAIAFACVAPLLLGGCGNAVDNTPPAAAMAPRTAAPAKIPTTPDEKIAAIEKSPIPEEQKKAAIEKVRSGSL